MGKLYVKNSLSKDYKDFLSLLEREGIKGENSIQDTFGIHEGEKLMATASRFQNIIKQIAVDSAYYGTKVFNELISFFHAKVVNAGFSSCYVYTKERAGKWFAYVGIQDME